jgi:hypothetical protein
LEKELSNYVDNGNDNKNKLKTDIVSEIDHQKSIKRLINPTFKEYSDKSKSKEEIHATDITSDVSISDKSNININRAFKKDDEITVQFVIKTSADKKVIGDGINGINKYYGDIYYLVFVIEKNDPTATDPNNKISHKAVNSSGTMLNIKILKPNKLQ